MTCKLAGFRRTAIYYFSVRIERWDKSARAARSPILVHGADAAGQPAHAAARREPRRGPCARQRRRDGRGRRGSPRRPSGGGL